MLAAIVTTTRPGWEHAVVNLSGENRELAEACAPVPVATSGGPSLLGGRHTASKALDELTPDLVHAHLPLAMAILGTLPRRDERARIATHHHGDHFFVSGRPVAERVDRAAAGRVDRLVAPSEAVSRFLLERYRHSPRRVCTIMNGWNGEPLPANGSGTAPPTVVSIANFRPQKNHALLLRAFARARERVPAARLLLVGGGPEEGEVRRLAEALGLADAVRFTGYVNDVWPYLARSHVFALSSSYEPLGVAVLEGMAAGLPVVATAVGGIPELVRPGKNGLLVEPGDVEGFADALAQLLSSPELAHSLGEVGRSTAAEHTAAKMVDRYFGLYAELLEGQVLL